MPSPIAHLSAGYVLFAVFRRHLSPRVLAFTGRGAILLLICLSFSMLPDTDAILGFASGNMGRFHNQWSHSLIVAAAVSSVVALIAQRRLGCTFRAWFTLFFSCYGIHILMDYFTYGRGCRIFWPVNSARFKPDQSFFGGLRWSEGIFSSNHIWTAIEEVSFAAILIGTYYVIEIICKRIRD